MLADGSSLAGTPMTHISDRKMSEKMNGKVTARPPIWGGNQSPILTRVTSVIATTSMATMLVQVAAALQRLADALDSIQQGAGQLVSIFGR